LKLWVPIPMWLRSCCSARSSGAAQTWRGTTVNAVGGGGGGGRGTCGGDAFVISRTGGAGCG
jgi:hypothetical protein